MKAFNALGKYFFLCHWAREGDAGGNGKTALHNTSVDTPGMDLAAGAIGMVTSRICLAVPSIGDRDHAVVLTTDHTATGSASSTSRDWDTAIDGTGGRAGRSNTGAMVCGASEVTTTTSADTTHRRDLAGPSVEHFHCTTDDACDMTAAGAVLWASSRWNVSCRHEWGNRSNCRELSLRDLVLGGRGEGVSC